MNFSTDMPILWHIDAKLEYEKLDNYTYAWYNNGRKGMYAESVFRLPDNSHISSKQV